jgi:signal transduction histidine kinase
MLTARSDVDDRLAGVEVGVNAYMAKPFFAKELLGTVRALLEKQQSTAEMLLEQRMGSLETVASGLAHEINNPLNWVKNALTRIRMDVTSLRAELVRETRDTTKLETLEERIAKMFGTAESGVARIGQTVELMGRYSREGFTRAMRNHDLFASARDVVDLLVPGSGRDIRVNAHFDGDGVAECVPEEMIQVITNVVQNAIDAVADGTGRVEVRGRAEDGVVILEVSDNGPGIPADTRARLFTPFFTTKGPGRGMGLGLTITWRVVHALGGTVQVDSEPGLGTKFTLRIPRTRQAPAVGAA